MGQGPVRVHQVPEGLHEQQGRPEGHVRAQGGPDAPGQVHHPQPAARHAGGGQADGSRLPRPSRRPREDPGSHHHRRRNQRNGAVLSDRPRLTDQEQRASADSLHGLDQRHHLVGRGSRLQDAPPERVHALRPHRRHRRKHDSSFLLRKQLGSNEDILKKTSRMRLVHGSSRELRVALFMFQG